MSFDWDKLKTFYQVAKIESFTIAAKNMNLSQSATSRQILCLEDRLKTKLFDRTRKKLQLTEQGEIWYKTTEKMFSDVETAQSLADDIQSTPQGHLKIATSSGFATKLVKQLPQLLDKYPKLRLSIFSTDKDPDLNLKEADIAILPQIAKKEDWIQRKILSYHLRLYASPKYLEKFGTPKNPQDLDNHRLIAYGDHAHPFKNVDDWHLSLGCPKGKRRDSYIQVNSDENLFFGAQQGLGIVTLAQGNERVVGSDLVEVLPEIKGPTIDFYLIYPEHLKGSQRLKALEEYLEIII